MAEMQPNGCFREDRLGRNGFTLTNGLLKNKYSQRGNTALIAAMWFDKDVEREVSRRLRRSKASPLFFKSFRALFRIDTPCESEWKSSQTRAGNPSSISEYRHTFQYALPTKWPSLTHIKTTAVYAATDRYRADDLVNVNSHTSSTERLFYLTDANKDWVNLNGRINRIVQTDLSFCVYKPSLSRVAREARSRFANTVLTSSLSCRDAKVDVVGIGRVPQLQVSDDSTDFIVVEIPETVVYMLHYLGEAEKHEESLRRRNPEFFFEDVLVKAEWLSMILESMDPTVIKEGQETYERIANVLPSLFDHEMNVRLGE